MKIITLRSIACGFILAGLFSPAAAQAQTAPVANNFSTIGAINSDKTYIQLQLYTDWTNDPGNLIYTIISNAQHGVVTDLGSSYVLYTPSNNFFGADVFSWRAADGSKVSGVATCSIIVSNSILFGIPGSNIVFTGTGRSVTTPDYISFSASEDSKSFTYAVKTQPAHGTVTSAGSHSGISYGPSWKYTSTALFIGNDTYTWTVSDGTTVSTPVKDTITVISNCAPVVANNALITTPFALQTVLLNQSTTLQGGDPVSDCIYSIVQGPTSGTATVTSGSTYQCQYQCTNQNYRGSDPFTWRAASGSLLSGIATCSVTVVPITAPTALPFQLSASCGVPVTNYFGGYANVPAVDAGQTVTYYFQTTNGTVNFPYGTDSANMIYTSKSSFSGTDRFPWGVIAGSVTSTPAICTITVAPNRPVPQNQTLAVLKNGAVSNISLSYLYSGGYTCWPVRVSLPTNGTLTTNGNVFTYTARTNWTGNDSFKWNLACKTNGGATLLTATATCTIVVEDLGSNTNGDWLQWRFDECRTAHSPAAGPDPANLHLQWQRTLPACAGTFVCGFNVNDFDLDYCKPVQIGKQLLVSLMANDSVTAYNTDTGAQNWRYYTSGALRRPPAAAVLPNGTNVVIFGCDDGTVYCLNALNGSEIWKFRAAPKNYKVMGFGRLSSAWPVLASPVIYSNKVYFVAGFIPSWNLFAYCLDAATGAVLWFNDGRLLLGGGTTANAGFAPLNFSLDHSRIDESAQGTLYGWRMNPITGEWSGTGAMGQADRYYDGFGDATLGEPNGIGHDNSTRGPSISEPMTITAGGQTFTAETAASLNITGTLGSMLVGDGKLFVAAYDTTTTTDPFSITGPYAVIGSSQRIYCYGANVVQPNIYTYTTTPLPSTNDAWTLVVQNMLTNRPDLQEGLALVWGVGSGRLVTELAKQAPGLMIVAADPDPAKLRAIRTNMDAAGWSGARVSTLQGNPMDCGFAPYQAALTVSEDVNVAGYSSNVLSMAKMMYKCTRPYGGEIWLPTSNAQAAAIVNALNTANLPTCSNQTSYAVTFQTGVTVPGVAGFTRIKRTGFPDCEQFVHPPFRPLAFGPSGVEDSRYLDPLVPGSQAITGWIFPMFEPQWGIKQSHFGVAHDLYSWLPRTIAESDYDPSANTTNQQTSAYNSLNNGSWNPLYSRFEPAPFTAITLCGGSSGALAMGSGSQTTYGDLVLQYFYDLYFANQSSNYWGVLSVPEIQSCSPQEINPFAGDGIAVFGNSRPRCAATLVPLQWSMTSSDDGSDEIWVNYYLARTTHPVQGKPAQHAAINFGAPGDRYDAATQTAWTHHPAMGRNIMNGVITPSESLPLIPVSYRGTNVGVVYHSTLPLTVTNAARGWISPSRVQGMTGMTISLAQPLVAARAATPPVINGALNDACWNSCTPINLQTLSGGGGSCNTNGTNCTFMMCYDTTNLYIAGVLHQLGQRPFWGCPYPVYMKVAFAGRDRLIPAAQSMQTLQMLLGQGGPQSTVLPTNAWTGAYATNVEMFAGEMCIPWASLASAGIWSSQLVMNVEICGNILNGYIVGQWTHYAAAPSASLGAGPTYNHDGVIVTPASPNNPDTVLPLYLSPVYLDAARGEVTNLTPHTVRLYFTEMDGFTNGQRVFDVQLQGQTVLPNFDVYAAAGGAQREVMKEFQNICFGNQLNIDFVAHVGQPMLSSIEIIATGAQPATMPPVPLLDASTISGPCPLAVQFSAQRSYAPAGQIVECTWDTGDGRLARGSLLNHVFTEPGTYTVSLLALDNCGSTAATNITVTVTAGVPAAFVCNIRSNNALNCDFTTLSAWVAAMQSSSGGCDLLSTTTIFKVSAQTGTINTGMPVTFTGGKTGVLRAVTSWVTNGITNTYAEVAYVGGTGTVMNGSVAINIPGWFTPGSFAISDTGVLTTSLLFTVLSTNTYTATTDDGQVVTFTGGGMGRLKHINCATPNLALITECSGAIQTGLVTCGTSGHTFTISDTGHPVCTVVANCYSDWPNGLNNSTSLSGSGWITEPSHCPIIRAAAGQGHAGYLKGTNGYTGFALISALTTYAPYTRINQIIVDMATISIASAQSYTATGVGCSVNRVLGSVSCVTGLASLGGIIDGGIVIANSIGPVFNAIGSANGQNIGIYNCTGGSFLLSDLNINHMRAVNCLSYSNSFGFTVDPKQEIWLSHCVSVDGTATGSSSWNDGNVGNLANKTVTFINAATNNYLLAANDTGARGMGQPGLGADVTGNLRTGPVYDVGAYQSTNVMSAFQQWQLACYGSLTAPNAASNAVNSAGFSNWQMFLAGSNPNDSNTWFRFTGIAPVTGSKWGVKFNTVTGKLYSVKWKTNLLDGLGWVYYTNFSGLGGSTQVIFTNALPQAFFQIQAQ